MTRHPDLLTRPEAAALLGVKPGTMARGFGPPPLPAYRRPVYYSRKQCQRWLAAQRKAASWDSTNAKAPLSGGVASKSRVTKSSARLERKIAERLRLKSAGSEVSTKPKHLVAVPQDA